MPNRRDSQEPTHRLSVVSGTLNQYRSCGLRLLVASATSLLLIAAALAPACALSNTDLRRPPPDGIALAPAPAFGSEEHVVFGPEVSVTSSSAGSGWSFGSAGGSWYTWSYETLLDCVDLPLWPNAMANARIVLSSEMCRTDTTIPLPPFMPPGDLELCGTHIMATAKRNTPQGAPIAAVRSQMRQWLSQFVGGDDESDYSTTPDTFIDLGDSSIYHFRPFNPRTLSLDGDSQLDLLALLRRSAHCLRDLARPKIAYDDGRQPDNYRLEVRLQQTAHGFISLNVQLISLLRHAPEISIEPLENSTSRITWIGPNENAMSFSLATNHSKPEALQVPAEFFARDSLQFAGDMTARTVDYASFHPSVRITADLKPGFAAAWDTCRLYMLMELPRTYFFDPYQLSQQRKDGQLDTEYEHYGIVELEKPAEAVSNWGSVAVLSRDIQQQQHSPQISTLVPIHMRYRLLPVKEPTVGYHGESTGDSHVDLTMPPPLSALVCLPAKPPTVPDTGSVLDKLRIRLALFEELGITPTHSLKIAPDTDMLLRAPVPDGTHTTLIQISTVVLMFAGALYVVHTIRRKVAST
ncbi:protease B nonderepressible form [Coemansia guatemalensis]|uniref:Protein PBN1 n=1 Tax=Coemansia guatemalensis TaxID=2761395 RepID=A0A9W8HT08_9FUNG|nr:protease B nonderepressible form [Coemansia guatemalensis]